MANNVIFFKTIKKTNVVILANPSKRKLLYTTGARQGKVKQIQPIMYCKEYDTIVVEELKKIDPDARPTSLIAKKGVFRVQEDDIYLLQYLRDTEQNIENGGKLFKEINVAEEELFQIEGYEAFDKAVKAVMTATKEHTLALGIEFISPSATTMSIQKIKLQLRSKLTSDDNLVKSVNAYIANKISQETVAISVALAEGIIELHEGRKFVWSDGQEMFFNASQAGDATKELALWLKTDKDGKQYLKHLSKKISELEAVN